VKQPSIEIDRKEKLVTIVMPLEKPRPSKSTGKTRVIATTGGLKTSTESYDSAASVLHRQRVLFPKEHRSNQRPPWGD